MGSAVLISWEPKSTARREKRHDSQSERDMEILSDTAFETLETLGLWELHWRGEIRL